MKDRCPRCRGRGWNPDPYFGKHDCKRCNGKGRAVEYKNFQDVDLSGTGNGVTSLGNAHDIECEREDCEKPAEIQFGYDGPLLCHYHYMTACSYCWDHATVTVQIDCPRNEWDRPIGNWQKSLCTTCAQQFRKQITKKEGSV